jgi:hypothetical protein
MQSDASLRVAVDCHLPVCVLRQHPRHSPRCGNDANGQCLELQPGADEHGGGVSAGCLQGDVVSGPAGSVNGELPFASAAPLRLGRCLVSPRPRALFTAAAALSPKGEPVLHPTVAALKPLTNPTRATVRDCLDDTHWLNYKSSGGLQDNQPGGHRLVNATVTLAGGVWKVSILQTGAEGTC